MCWRGGRWGWFGRFSAGWSPVIFSGGGRSSAKMTQPYLKATPYEDRDVLLPGAVAARAMGARLRQHGGAGVADRAHGRVRLVHDGAEGGGVSLRLAERMRGDGGEAEDG